MLARAARHKQAHAPPSLSLSHLPRQTGALCLLCGGAISTTEPRTGVTFAGNFLGGAVLYVIAAAFFFLAALFNIVVAAKKTEGLISAIIALLGGITFIVGAALWFGSLNSGGYTLIAGGSLGDTNASSAGSILILIAFFLFFVASAELCATAVHAAVRQAASTSSHDTCRSSSAHMRAAALVAAGWALGIVASAAYVVLTGPGFQLLGAVLFIVSGSVLAFGFAVKVFATCITPCGPEPASAAPAAAAPAAAHASAPAAAASSAAPGSAAAPAMPAQATGEAKAEAPPASA